MPSRYPPVASYGNYTPQHLNAAQGTAARIGLAGVFLGPIHVNGIGTGAFTLTLWNGNPASGGTVFAILTSAGSVPFALAIDHGLWYTLAATGTPDVTVSYKDMAV